MRSFDRGSYECCVESEKFSEWQDMSPALQLFSGWLSSGIGRPGIWSTEGWSNPVLSSHDTNPGSGPVSVILLGTTLWANLHRVLSQAAEMSTEFGAQLRSGSHRAGVLDGQTLFTM